MYKMMYILSRRLGVGMRRLVSRWSWAGAGQAALALIRIPPQARSAEPVSSSSVGGSAIGPFEQMRGSSSPHDLRQSNHPP
jgi:hypothetical protein